MSGEPQSRVRAPLQASVSVNVYDIHWTSRFSAWMGLGMYHSAVVIYGREFAYGGHVYRDSGIYHINPKSLEDLKGAENMRFRCTLNLGKTSMSQNEVWNTVEVMGLKWRGKDYNLLRNNCNDFSNEFGIVLCGTGLPSWVNRLARYGGPLIEPFVPKSWIQFRRPPGTPSTRPKTETIGDDRNLNIVPVSLEEVAEIADDPKKELVDPRPLENSCTSGDETSTILTTDMSSTTLKTDVELEQGQVCSDAEVSMGHKREVAFLKSTGRKLVRSLSECAVRGQSCLPPNRRSRSLAPSSSSAKHVVFDSVINSGMNRPKIKLQRRQRSTSKSRRLRKHRSRPDLRKSRRLQQHPKPGCSRSRRRRIVKKCAEPGFTASHVTACDVRSNNSQSSPKSTDSNETKF